MGEFDVAEGPVVFLCHALPGRKVHLVDANRLFGPLLAGAILHPALVRPGESPEVVDDRGGLLSVLAIESERVALQADLPVVSLDLKFVVAAFFDSGDKNFPDTAAKQFAHGLDAAVPVVEITDYADALRVGGPDAEDRALHAIDFGEMRSEFLVKIPVVSLGMQVDVRIAKDAAEGIRVTRFPLLAIVRLEAQDVRKLRGILGEDCFEKSFRMDFHRLELARTIASVDHRDRGRIGPEDTHREEIAGGPHAQSVERIGVACFEKGGKLFGRDGGLRHGREASTTSQHGKKYRAHPWAARAVVNQLRPRSWPKLHLRRGGTA